MSRFIFRRLVSGAITIWFIATATFIGMHSVPGDPLLNDKAVTPEIRRNLEQRYGLDKPLTEQYVIFMRNMLRGDFGISFTQQNRRGGGSGRPTGPSIRRRRPTAGSSAESRARRP